MKPGDYVMVQVTKEETAEKGARLTMNLSLPGRYVVYLPTMDFVGVSGKITDGETRDRLTKLLTRLKPPGGGLIARTVSIDAKKSEIVAEVKQITAMYRDIVKAYEAAGEHTALVHSEGNLIVRTVRDMLSADVDAIVCNDREMTDELVARLKKSHPRFAGMVHLYEGEYDMSDAYGILDGVEKLLHKRVDLPSGGSIVIEPTEALTAIDVNTGRYSGDVDHEDTVFRTNLEAAEEIARQLRLRNIGGIVVIDFIDMADEKHKAAVVEALKKEMLLDRTKTRVLGMSDMGLVELTRKKDRPGHRQDSADRMSRLPRQRIHAVGRLSGAQDQMPLKTAVRRRRVCPARWLPCTRATSTTCSRAAFSPASARPSGRTSASISCRPRPSGRRSLSYTGCVRR